MATINYEAVRVRQTADGPWIVFFAAPASEIDQWSGIPQKRKLGDQETTGFQREVNSKRLEGLNAFYGDNANTVQNALLAATRKSEKAKVEFVAAATSADGFSETGKLTITYEDLSVLSLKSLLEMLRATIIDRVPSLKEAQPPTALIAKLKESVSVPITDTILVDGLETGETEADGSGDSETNGNENEEPEEALYAEETYVLEFFHEVAARCIVLNEIPAFTGDDFAGFTKDAVTSFLKPIILVDGQHRLEGALLHARNSLKKSPVREQLEEAIANGRPAKEVEMEFWPKVCRRLPISLLICDDPAEHVFQFVIVNQKATPIGRALLGTIVATTLSENELSRVSERLKAAGIQIEESRHVAFLSRSSESPFNGVVERGLASDSNNLLPFSVMVSLVKVFRDLKDGRLWGNKNDYADLWRRKHLEDSDIVGGWNSSGKYRDAYAFWRSDEGPWRKAFMVFWQAVKQKLSSLDPDDQNCWGDTRHSNLFNKIYLHILLADFFQFLTEVRKGIDSTSDISVHVEDWLQDVQSSYFRRDWKMENQKKDVPGIRKQWATLWVDYRKNPQRAPSVNLFRQAAP